VSSRHRLPKGRPDSGKETPESADAAETPEAPDAAVTETADAETAEAETTEAEAAAAETAEAETAEDVETADAETPAAETAEYPEDSTESDEVREAAKRKRDWPRVLAYGVLPGLALLLALAAGFARWEYVASDYGSLPPVASEQNPSPAMDSIAAAKESTIKMLSYKPDTVEQQLNSARDLLTGEFRDSYTSLINDVVIPGAKQKQISAVASVPAAASVSADPTRAVVMVFVNQTVVVGQDLPSDTASSVRVTMEKVDGRWLISEFEPV
jgi:Mce-associated membrane protein